MGASGAPKRKFKQNVVTGQELFGGSGIKEEENADKVVHGVPNPLDIAL